MVTKNQFIEELKKNDKVTCDNDKLYLAGKPIDVDSLYEQFLKKNGMSFNCICDVHWECMSILECTECGTVVRYYYDEYYEPNFKCPVCTDYKTGYEYHTKEEIEKDEKLQAIIKMYKDLNDTMEKQDERKEKRNGLNDWQLTKPRYIKTKNGAYKYGFVIDSITNKNKLKGLRLEISKLERDETGLYGKWTKSIPLSIEALRIYRQMKYLERHPEIDPLEELKGKPLSQSMEEAAVLRMKKNNKE